jgi:hypothetical protein
MGKLDRLQAKRARQAVRKAENDRQRRREARLAELLIAMMKSTDGLAAQAEVFAKALFARPIDIEDFELNGHTTWFAKVRLDTTDAEEAAVPSPPSRSKAVAVNAIASASSVGASGKPNAPSGGSTHSAVSSQSGSSGANKSSLHGDSALEESLNGAAVVKARPHAESSLVPPG